MNMDLSCRQPHTSSIPFALMRRLFLRARHLPPLLLIMLAAGPGRAQSAADLQIIPGSAAFSGCGFGLKFSTAKASDSRLVFWWDFGAEAIVHVSGKLHRLKPVAEKDIGQGSSRVFSEEWSGPGIKVRIVYRVMRNYEESGDVKGTLTLFSGHLVREYKVVGFKGC
jgi:hypothetical protein